ncbi:MAG: phosphoglycerate dehydrogenase [Pseudomonadota bacterium]|nr:phosphoglycerate dehydrogenase [Pseudomonadota bacterium]
MSVLIVEPLDGEVLQWLGARHALRFAPELARNRQAFRHALATVRAVITPPSVALDTETLRWAPHLRLIGRFSVGGENIDLQTCARIGVQVVRPSGASAAAEAEFVIAALLQMLRRVPVLSNEGLLAGRELGGSRVGIVGLTPTVSVLAPLLRAFGSNLLGYDPAVHATDPAWQQVGVEPAGLTELMRRSDAVCVLLGYYPRYVGLFGERLLAECRRDQVLVNLSHSSLFNPGALAQALTVGSLAAAWFDSVEPGLLDAGRPLRHVDALQITPCVSGTTLQSRTRSAWSVVRRIDELLRSMPESASFRQQRPAVPADLASGPAPA